jgi:hypothetical protein
MKKSPLITLKAPITINDHMITGVIIGQHYKDNHAESINDEIVIQLILALDEKTFTPDSTSKGIEYYVSDVQVQNSESKNKYYRLVWLLEGDFLEIIGVINAYRIKKAKKGGL